MGCGPRCSGCSLERIGTGFTEIEIGPRYEKSRLLLIGEASGQSEAQEGLPFRPHAQSGSLLADSMREAGITRGDVAVTNVIRCRPPKDYLEGAPYEWSAKTHCIREYLIPAIHQLQPRAILALGGVAQRSLTNASKGKAFQLEYARGYAWPGAGAAEGIPVVPTFHPAFIRRGAAHLTPLLRRDLKYAFRIAVGRANPILDPLSAGFRYQTAPTLAEARAWVDGLDPFSPLAFDLETPMSTRSDEEDRTSFTDRDIKLIQFCQQPGTGIALPWRDEYVDVAKRILSMSMTKVGFNCFNFDIPVLRANGVEVAGVVDDAMVLFHSYEPDLPANLQAVAQYCGWKWAWKHYASDQLAWYGIADVDSTLHIYNHMKELMS